MLQLPRQDGCYGLIHGDPGRSNFAVMPNGEVTLFDFDHSGFGWRAYDLAVCSASSYGDLEASCLEAYEAVRPLSATERELLPTFRRLIRIWDLGDVLAMRRAWDSDPPEKYARFSSEFADRAQERLERLFSI